MADDRIELEIVLDDGKVVQGFAKIQAAADDAAKKSGGSFEASLSGISSALKSVALAATAAFAAAGFATGKILKDGIQEAVDAENALNDLKAAFAAQGGDVESATSRMQSFAASLQAVTTVGDDAIIQSSAVLVSIGKLRGEGLEKATVAALNLAAGLNMDLGNAFELVAKAATGNAGALGRYGLKIDENLPKSDQFAQALQKINAAFGGAAEAKTMTYAGAMAQLKIAFDDVLENIGNMVIKSPALIAIIKSMADWFKSLGTSVEEFGKGRDVFGELAKGALSFGQALVTYVLSPLEFGYNIFRLLTSAVAWFVQGSIVLLAEFSKYITEYVFKPVGMAVEYIGKITGKVSEGFGTAFESIGQSMQKTPEVAAIAADATFAAWKDIGTAFSKNAENLFSFDTSLATSNFLSGVQATVESAKEPIRETGRIAGQALVDGFKVPTLEVNSISEAFKLGLTEVSITAIDVAKTIQNALVQGFSNSFAALGKGLATGKNGFQEFGNQILSTLGGLAIQLGQFFILIGAGLSSTGALFGLSGSGAIAAGIGLTVLGGVLQGIAGSAGTSSSASTSASAGASSVSPELTTAPELDQSGNKRTDVTINVQGNILDRRESGLAIADILNEYFSANDGRVVATA